MGNSIPKMLIAAIFWWLLVQDLRHILFLLHQRDGLGYAEALLWQLFSWAVGVICGVFVGLYFREFLFLAPIVAFFVQAVVRGFIVAHT